MSADHDHQEGPIKTPMQLLMTVFFSFVAPVFIIIGLVYFVLSYAKPAGSGSELGGLTQAELAAAVERRITKVGTVEIRDANRPLALGEAVYKAQCVACHGGAVAAAPKLGDVAAWGARIATGYEALLTSALKGKGAMGAQGGGDFEDVEIGRAVVYMANAAGGKFPVPERATPADATAAAAPAPAASAAK
jgi:cytochrome c5